MRFDHNFFLRLVYLYGYSPDKTLKGYVNNSLAYINVSDLEQEFLPVDRYKHLNYTLPFCRYSLTRWGCDKFFLQQILNHLPAALCIATEWNNTNRAYLGALPAHGQQEALIAVSHYGGFLFLERGIIMWSVSNEKLHFKVEVKSVLCIDAAHNNVRAFWRKTAQISLVSIFSERKLQPTPI